MAEVDFSSVPTLALLCQLSAATPAETCATQCPCCWCWLDWQFGGSGGPFMPGWQKAQFSSYLQLPFIMKWRHTGLLDMSGRRKQSQPLLLVAFSRADHTNQLADSECQLSRNERNDTFNPFCIVSYQLNVSYWCIPKKRQKSLSWLG